MVTGGEAVDSVADLDDHPGTFVSAQHRERGDGYVPGDDVVIRVAHPRELELYFHLTTARVAELDFIDRPGLVEVPQQRTLGFHLRAFLYRPLGNLSDADHASPAARRMILSGFKNGTCGSPAILTTTRPDD